MSSYLELCRIEQAKLYFVNPNISITEVAVLCGYNSISAFGRAFKKMSVLHQIITEKNTKIFKRIEYIMKIPKIIGEYINAYIPKGDTYFGVKTEQFEFGQYHEIWVPNDHIIIKGDDNCWHGFGITHPVTETMPKASHEGELQSFHCVTKQGAFADVLGEDCFKDKPKVLYPQTRPNENPSQHSPAIVKKDDLWYMFYGPEHMRYAVSTDLYNWTPKGSVFQDHPTSRDPHIMLDNGTYYMTYCIENSVATRTSVDLINWSDKTIIFNMQVPGEPESPVLLKYEDTYYLIWCIWDSTVKGSDPYDARSYVMASKNPLNFNEGKPVAELYGHCPEILVDEKGEYYISSADKPYRGVNVAKIEWVEKEN